MSKLIERFSNAKKFLRYIVLYGPRRTFAKAGYRSKPGKLSWVFLKLAFSRFSQRSEKRIIIVGLGMHGFSTIAFFLNKNRYQITAVVDPSSKAKWLAENILNCDYYKDLATIKECKEFYGDLIYIASDHATHLTYAEAASKTFASIYLEKPLISSHRDRTSLMKFFQQYEGNFFSGYNRPHSPLYKKMIDNIRADKFACTMIINGHYLDESHWYRAVGQGSRILGNCTHWIDLALRIIVNEAREKVVIRVVIDSGVDDSVLIRLTTSKGNSVTINFSAFVEPRDGVEEFIYWNTDKSIGNIDNFQSFNVKHNGAVIKKRNYTKDVGHEATVLAPLLLSENYKDIIGVNSALLAVEIEEATKQGERQFTFHYGEEQ